MNPILAIVLAVSFLFALFNSKLSIWSIIFRQKDIYKNASNKKPSLFDYYVFFGVPIIFGVVIAIELPISILIENAGILITVISVVASVLLAFLGIIVDKANHKNDIVRQVVKETVVTITLNIVYSLIVIALIVIAMIVQDIIYLNNIIVGLVGYLMVKFVINILMIIKRIYKIIDVED